ASLNFRVVAAEPLRLAGAVLGIMALKGVVMFLLARRDKLHRRDAAAVAVSLSQVGEFAFVLIGLIAGAQIIGAESAAFLTAVVALSMALTPLAFAAYDKVNAVIEARREKNGREQSGAGKAKPETDPFDEGHPDVIIAGYGRFGQIAGRLLTANNFKTVVLDASIEHIELLRRFGRRVHYGDATRLDLLRDAGAEHAKVLLVAIDDTDATAKLVETAHEAFPNLKIIARAWDRRH